MSAQSRGKNKFAGFFKSLFGKSVDAEDQTPQPPVIASETKPATFAPATKSKPSTAASANGNGNGLYLPVQTILNALPIELRGRARQTDLGDLTIAVPLEKVFSQLALGAVKITFGELRRAVPQVFADDSSQDQVPVALPLDEILSRLNPSLLNRRSSQKQVEISDNITSPFGNRGQGLVLSVNTAKPKFMPAPPAPAGLRTPIPLSPATKDPARASLASVVTPPPPPQLPRTPAIPSRPSFSASPASTPPPMQRSAPPAPRNVPVPPATPAAVPAQTAKSPAHQINLAVPLAALSENWPDPLLQEIAQSNLMNAKVALPVDMVEPALKRGRVVFPWRTLRSWIKPAPSQNVSANDSVDLELPLKVIAPLFISQRSANAGSHRKVAVDPDIPDLFFGFPKPETSAQPAAPAPVAKTPDTNYYIWDESEDVAYLEKMENKRKPSPGTAFVTRCATPNEVVSRAAALDGVVGALIALPDGLMVASQIPPELNADTMAAFLPHIFGKVSQCTKELRMGDLNNLNFTVGNIPWKIFRVNAIFFAAFGRAGEALPTAQLAALAAELDRKKTN